jgi:hypothetical protein
VSLAEEFTQLGVEAFLSKHLLFVIVDQQAPGIYDFSIDETSVGLGGVPSCDLKIAGGAGANTIKAYWCPYKEKETKESPVLGTDKDNPKYFFTYDLSGCRLLIGPGLNPKVIHIPGKLADSTEVVRLAARGKPTGPVERPRRDEEERRVAGQHGWKNPHRLSSSYDLDRYGAEFTIAGERTPFGHWQFYKQGKRAVGEDMCQYERLGKAELFYSSESRSGAVSILR